MRTVPTSVTVPTRTPNRTLSPMWNSMISTSDVGRTTARGHDRRHGGVGSAITPVSSTRLCSGDTRLRPEPSRSSFNGGRRFGAGRCAGQHRRKPVGVAANTTAQLRTGQINANVLRSGDRPVYGVRRPHTSADANARRMLSSLTRPDGRSRRARRARRAPQCAAVARNPPEGALPSTDLGRSTMRIRKR